MKRLLFHQLFDGPNIAKGSSSLRILGEKMSQIDFLVREAIQNSSDACYRARKDGKTFVCVDFDTGTFRSAEFNSIFNESIEKVLNRRYPDGNYKWIAISDYNCEGLNGDVHPKDLNFRSNFCRLICDSGEAQDKEGSGGCWGYGKSVYYRIGIGIVIFYSRFLGDDGKYHSRLIIKLVEDEKKPDAILRQAGCEKSAGIAWWCKEVRENWVFPIEDEKEIVDILRIFGVKKYEDEDGHGDAELTGTKIIVPYFDPAAVCAGLLPKVGGETSLTADQERQIVELVSDVSTALRFSTLRWYSSRLGNSWLRNYNNCESNVSARIPLLKVRVQGEPVNVDAATVPDFFRATQELYNKALYEAAKFYWPTASITAPRATILKATPSIEFVIKNYLTPAKAGWIVHSVFKPANAAMPNPYILTNKYSMLDGENPPMILFMREPGMVIDYSIGDEWLKNVGSTDQKGEFVIALFYPNVKAMLREDVWRCYPKFSNKNLGFYLRSCEEAEHSNWIEPSGLRIVERIRVNCAQKLSKVYSKMVEATGGASSFFANYLSNRLMRPPKASTGLGVGTGVRHSSITIDGVDAGTPGKIVVEYTFHLLKIDQDVSCSLQLALDNGYVDCQKWESKDSKYDGRFPARIISFTIDRITPGDYTLIPGKNLLGISVPGLDFTCNPDAQKIMFGGNRTRDLELRGVMTIQTDSPMYKFRFAVSAVKHLESGGQNGR